MPDVPIIALGWLGAVTLVPLCYSFHSVTDWLHSPNSHASGWDVLSDGSNVARLRSHCRALKLANSEAEGQSRERKDAWCREIQLQQSRVLSRAH